MGVLEARSMEARRNVRTRRTVAVAPNRCNSGNADVARAIYELSVARPRNSELRAGSREEM
jgi:hypothetical protein